MTSAEALRELRLLVREVRSGRLVNANDRDSILWTIREVLDSGVDPVIELRIRHLKRRAMLRKV